MLKIAFGWGFAPDPTGKLTALPRPLAALKGPLRGRVREERREGKGSINKWSMKQQNKTSFISLTCFQGEIANMN
jgi:hypothetical protein